MTTPPFDTHSLLLDLVRGQAATRATLEAISSRIDSQAGEVSKLTAAKDSSHLTIYARLDSLEATRDKLVGLALGIGLGAGAAGGAAGAAVTSLLGG